SRGRPRLSRAPSFDVRDPEDVAAGPRRRARGRRIDPADEAGVRHDRRDVPAGTAEVEDAVHVVAPSPTSVEGDLDRKIENRHPPSATRGACAHREGKGKRTRGPGLLRSGGKMYSTSLQKIRRGGAKLVVRASGEVGMSAPRRGMPPGLGPA